MKQCAHCKEFKPEEEFAYANKILKVRQKQCRACIKEFNRNTYERRSEERKQEVRDSKNARLDVGRKYVWEYLSVHPCINCGESDPVVLEFDHIAGGKHLNVSDMVRRGYAIEALKEEIAKCQVLCSNCHRRKTHKERGWFKG